MATARRACLDGAKLLGACVERANLKEASLSHTSLAGANLDNADLSAANLSRASFATSMDLRRGSWDWVKVEPAHLFGTKLADSDLNEANLRGVGLSAATVEGNRTVNWALGLLPVTPQISTLALRTNSVEKLVDIDLSLFPCSTCTRVRLFLDLPHNIDLQLSITAPGAVIGIPHRMTRNRATLLALPGLLEVFQTILGLLNEQVLAA